MCCILIGTHGDVQDKRQVTEDEIKDCASSLKYKYFVTSAVDGTNVDAAFQEMGRLILSKTKSEESDIQSARERRGVTRRPCCGFEGDEEGEEWMCLLTFMSV